MSEFDVAVRDGVVRIHRPGTRWLATGTDGGLRTADAAYNLAVPDGFDRTDLDAYVAERLADAGFDDASDDRGPALLTGVEMRHARGAHADPVVAVATVGLSNPAALPVDAPGEGRDADGSDGDPSGPSGIDSSGRPGGDAPGSREGDSPGPPGTVNLLVGTTRALDAGGLAELLATAVEAKTTTLLALTDFTGTTTDAVAVGCDPAGEPAAFAGSATRVGAAARACVREAVGASLASRYPDGAFPPSVADAEYGVVTDGRATAFAIE